MEIMKLFNLTGKVAIVTGGNRGIGLGITRGLAQAGATVIIANRDAGGGKKAADALQKEGFKVDAVPVDMSSVPSISSMISNVIKKYKKIDILVNNAGVNIKKPVEEITEADWDIMHSTDLKGVFFCCQIAGKEMIRQKSGNIINVSSVNSVKASTNRTVYCSAKSGVTMLTKSLAAEWAKHNIKVNAIAPGLTITDINRQYFQDRPDEFQKTLASIPMAKSADIMDYAGAAVYFASDASGYVTGQTLFVDGGMTAV